MFDYEYYTRLAISREIILFPRAVGNNGKRRDLMGNTGKYWEIPGSCLSFRKKVLIYIVAYQPLPGVILPLKAYWSSAQQNMGV